MLPFFLIQKLMNLKKIMKIDLTQVPYRDYINETINFYNFFKQRKMKKTNFLLFTIALFFFSVNANFIQAQQTPAGYIDVIVVFATQNDADLYRNLLNAQELDYTQPSQARLWRIRQGTQGILPNGTPFSINSTGDAIGTIGGGLVCIGAGENSITKAPLNETSGTLNNAFQSCWEMPSCLTAVQSVRESMRIYIFDTGTDMFNTLNAPFLTTANAWNYVNNNNNVQDNHPQGHGTAVTGIVVKYLNYIISDDVKIVPIKVLDETGKGKVFDIIKAFDKATREQADIVNCSIVEKGQYYNGKPTPLQIAIDKAKEAEVLLVAGAGNDNKNIDDPNQPYFPASLPCDNQIVVGASNCRQNKSTFSNFGSINVDVFALGENIRTTGLGNTTVLATGTSFATPIVTGMAALIASQTSNRAYTIIKDKILSTVDYKTQLNGYCTTSGIVNICSAMRAMNSTRVINQKLTQMGPLSKEAFVVAPNSFSSETQISITTIEEAPLSIKLYNVLGTEVATVTQGTRPAGTHQIVFNAGQLNTGFYMFTAKTSNKTWTQKVFIQK